MMNVDISLRIATDVVDRAHCVLEEGPSLSVQARWR